MRYDRGQSFLALVFVIGAIVVAIGVTLAFLATSFTNGIYGYRYAAVAQAAALSGVQDALLQLERNSSFTSAGGYALAVGSSAVTVTVTQSTTPPTATVISVASLSGSIVKAKAIVNVNATTSAMSIQSLSFGP